MRPLQPLLSTPNPQTKIRTCKIKTAQLSLHLFQQPLLGMTQSHLSTQIPTLAWILRCSAHQGRRFQSLLILRCRCLRTSRCRSSVKLNRNLRGRSSAKLKCISKVRSSASINHNLRGTLKSNYRWWSKQRLSCPGRKSPQYTSSTRRYKPFIQNYKRVSSPGYRLGKFLVKYSGEKPKPKKTCPMEAPL